MDRYSEYIINKTREAKRKADGLAANIGHHGIEGQIRELAVKECIDPFLTASFSSSSGKIIDTKGGMSSQIDLIVYHKKVVPPIFVSPELGFFPIEAVRYVFEIKSTLTAKEIRDANKKFSTVANLFSGTQRKPTTVIMAMGSDASGSEILRYIKHSNNYEFPPCMVLCVLGKGYWWFQDKHWYGKDTSSEKCETFTEFTMFISGFMNSLSRFESSIIPFSPGTYMTSLSADKPDAIKWKAD